MPYHVVMQAPQLANRWHDFSGCSHGDEFRVVLRLDLLVLLQWAATLNVGGELTGLQTANTFLSSCKALGWKRPRWHPGIESFLPAPF